MSRGEGGEEGGGRKGRAWGKLEPVGRSAHSEEGRAGKLSTYNEINNGEGEAETLSQGGRGGRLVSSGVEGKEHGFYRAAQSREKLHKLMALGNGRRGGVEGGNVGKKGGGET